ncbi:MAG: CsbD family protein [Actinomycetes bacterium]
MDPKIEDATGRVKEAAGALTGNDDLKAEGAAEQASAQAQQAVNDAADAAKSAVQDVAGAAESVIDSVKDKLS